MARSLSLVCVLVVACLAVLASCDSWGHDLYPLHHKGYPHQVPDLGALTDPYNPYKHGHGYPWHGNPWHAPSAWHGYPGWGKQWAGGYGYPYGHHW